MRPILVLTLLAAACTSVDPLVGTYSVTVSGMDMVTTNPTSMSTVSGTGTVAITHGLATVPGGYDITIAQSDLTACTIKATVDEKDPLTVNGASGQSCTFSSNGSNVIATFTSAIAKENNDSISLTVAYTFSGSTLGFNYGGNGTRSYAGSRF